MASQPKTIQELGLGTLEQQGVGQAPTGIYTAYWNVYGQELLPKLTDDKVSPGDISRYRRMSEFVTHVGEVVIGEEDTSGLEGHDPTLWDAHRRHFGRAIQHWDNMHGHFNTALKDARGVLEHAASLAIQESAVISVDPLSVDIPAIRPKPLSIFAAIEQYPIERHVPGGDLFLAAELMHKAAWLEPDAADKTLLFDLAKQAYERIFDLAKRDYEQAIRDSSAAPSMGGLALRASGYIQDIKFGRMTDAYRRAIQNGDRALSIRALQALRSLMVDQTTALSDLYGQYDRSTADKERLKGSLLEQFIPILLRDAIIMNLEQNNHQPDDDFFAVRHAFSSEDMSPIARAARPGFDIVVQRFEGDKVITTPVQSKFNRTAKSQGADNGEARHIKASERYLPGIVMVRALALKPADIDRATHDLQCKYTRGDQKDYLEEFTRMVEFRGDLESQFEMAG